MSIATVTRIDYEKPAFLKALRQKETKLADLIQDLSDGATPDFSEIRGYKASTPQDASAVSMFARALIEAAPDADASGLVNALQGNWHYKLTDANGALVLDQDKKSIIVRGRTFSVHDPTARLSGTVMLNVSFVEKTVRSSVLKKMILVKIKFILQV